MIRKPTQANNVVGAARWPSVTSVSGLPITTPISCRPIRPRNRPMPAPMPSFNDIGMAFTSHSRMLQYADDEEQHARHEHRAQRDLPGHAHALHHGEGEVGVEPHARCERQRQIREQAHRRGADRRGDAGGDERGAMVDPRGRQDLRVDHDDVGHRQVRGESGQHLGADRSALLAEVEHTRSANRRSHPACSRTAHTARGSRP